MKVSRATFGRIIEQARKVVADALTNGKAINIDGGHYTIGVTERLFECGKCHYAWHEPRGTGRPKVCPSCDHEGVKRVSAK
jgi:uncharacterized protein